MESTPFLQKFSFSEWNRFLDDFEGYKCRGGTKGCKELVSTAVLRLLVIRRPALAELDGDEFVVAVSSLFAPASALESFDRFRLLGMRGASLSMDALLQYITAFNREELLCAAAMPPAAKLRQLFVSNLKPARLAERVEFRGPETLAEAKTFALEEAELLLAMTREVARVCPPTLQSPVGPRNQIEQRLGNAASTSNSHSSLSVNPSRASGHANETKQSERPSGGSDGRPLVCHGCGHSGHLRPNCPHKDVVGWVRTGRRLERLPLNSSREQSAQVKIASVGVGQVPRVPVLVLAHDGSELPVNALLDTGASVSLVSTEVYRRMLLAGVIVRQCKRQVVVANGQSVSLDLEVVCDIRVPGRNGGRQVQVRVELGVMDAGEDVVLGYPVPVSAGLLGLLDDVGKEEVVPVIDHAEDDISACEASAVHTVESLDGGLRELVEEFADVFDEVLPLGGALVDCMPVQLKAGMAPRALPPRRVSPVIREVIRGEVTALLDQGVIRPSVSPHSSPVVVVKKPDGSYRMCVDYRSVNDCTVDMKYPMQNVGVLLERMAGMRVFATLDLRSGFHQIPVDPAGIPLTAFATPDGLFEYMRVPFGLKNAPAYFQRAMSGVLSGLAGSVCEVFVDDIIVYGASQQEFVQNLRQVFERLRTFRLRLKRSKCKLGLAQVDYLGHVVSGSGIALSDRRKQGLADLQTPKGPTQLRSFLGLANYFRAFIPRYAETAKPLTRLCSDKVQFEWSPAAETAFLALKAAVMEAPMLHHLDYNLPIVLRTDASMAGVGAMLLQSVNGRECPVCFVSKAFTETEARWSTIEQEAYAVVYGVLSLSHHLLGHKFTVQTDHRNLLYLEKATAPKLVRWRLRLQEFDFDIEHVPGATNTVADALSRCFVVDLPHAADIARVHGPLVGHRGVHQTVRLLRASGVNWGSIHADVARFFASCPTCQKNRLGQGNMTPAVHTTEAAAPFEITSCY